MSTRRERIIDILKKSGRPLTINEIAYELGLNDPKEIKHLYDDIIHASRSLQRRSNGRLMIVMEPPKCAVCGFTFKELKRLRKPSKCPKCRSERILPPRFLIVET